MRNTEKILLRNEITIQLSRAKVTVNMLKQVKKEERQEFINIKLLEVNDASLRWALQKHVVTQSELTTDKFYTNNKHLNERVLKGTIATTGIVGSGYAFNVAIAPTFLGFGGGIGSNWNSQCSNYCSPSCCCKSWCIWNDKVSRT